MRQQSFDFELSAKLGRIKDLSVSQAMDFTPKQAMDLCAKIESGGKTGLTERLKFTLMENPDEVGKRVVDELSHAVGDNEAFTSLVGAFYVSTNRGILPHTLDVLEDHRRSSTLDYGKVKELHNLGYEISASSMALSDSEIYHEKIRAGHSPENLTTPSGIEDTMLKELNASRTRALNGRQAPLTQLAMGLDESLQLGDVTHLEKITRLMDGLTPRYAERVVDTLEKFSQNSRRFSAVLQSLDYSRLRDRLGDSLNALDEVEAPTSLDPNHLFRLTKVGLVYDQQTRGYTTSRIRQERRYMNGHSDEPDYVDTDISEAEMRARVRAMVGERVRVGRGRSLPVSEISDTRLFGIYVARSRDSMRAERAEERRLLRRLDEI